LTALQRPFALVWRAYRHTDVCIRLRTPDCFESYLRYPRFREIQTSADWTIDIVTSDRRDGPGFRVSRRRALTVGGAAAASVLSARGLSVATSATNRSAGRSERDAPADDADPIRRVHDAGVTGSGVRVAVLDPTGFDPTHAALADAVTDIRQFGAERAVVDRTTHGTAAAASVARLAPAASLLLASFRSPEEFVAAIDWCRTRDVDVVLAPVAAHGTAATPQSDVYRAARRAIESGTVVVAPTGNAALGHWRGPYAALAGDGPESRRRLRISALSAADSLSGRFLAWLVSDPSLDVDLTLALLRAVDGGERWNLVAVSQPVASRAGQRLVADLSEAEYALVVRPAGRTSSHSASAVRDSAGVEGGSAAGTGRIDVTTPTHALSPARPLGSIAAPASVPGVVGVGVTDVDRDAAPPTDATATASDAALPDPVSPYSGRGPTPQGGVGVDVVAPPRPWVADGRPGTSAAAARTAGVAALLRGIDPALSPSDVTEMLRRSAGDLGRPGRDLSSGWGRLDVVAAVQRVRAR
jgi:hypothetical protein